MTTQSDSAEQTLDRFALFISDLHLCASRPQITEAFLSFLDTTAQRYTALYILGDLFEYWAGDDDIDTQLNATICNALHALSQSGTQVYLMHGNRDFLIGQAFANRCGLTLLDDPTIITYQDQRILLSHGDALCTDDTSYQAMRQQFRNPEWQQTFLGQALTERKAQIEQIRLQSEQAKSEKSMMIMDVNDDAVSALLTQFEHPNSLIHGHTHRPNTHTHIVDGKTTTRHVLGDWYEQGSYLSLSSQGFNSTQL